MAELVPYPFAGLVARAFAELERNGSVFDLPRHRFFVPHAPVTVHGRTIAAPLGPSAGPHTQMAQGIVLSWLGGGRFIELKTVQRNDRLTIPRPCIDVRGIGLNVEWSQELRIEQSAEEYVKAWMLIRLLSAHLGVEPGCMFDMSAGYDLAGLRGDRMVEFLRTLQDASETIERLRAELPPRWRALDFDRHVSNSVTLSTFHGCPPDEIEAMADFILTDIGADCAIKLNPTLLGREHVLEILHDRLGYTNLRVPADAFARDLQWDDAVAMIGRLRARAALLGRSFAIKLTNTLVVENSSATLPATEKLAYLSGPPLHVIAMHLVKRFRDAFGPSLPISFSAGIDRQNYPDAVALGLAPVTVCTDLLKAGGYTRLQAYGTELERRRGETLTIDDYLARLEADPRYRADHVERVPKKTGEPLRVFNCATCDLCITTCPNDANFRLPSLEGFSRKHQIANFADLCNDCGNCESVCPDLGAPQRAKLRFFGSKESFMRNAPLDGFWIGRHATRARVNGMEHNEDHPLAAYARYAALDRTFIHYINAREDA